MKFYRCLTFFLTFLLTSFSIGFILHTSHHFIDHEHDSIPSPEKFIYISPNLTLKKNISNKVVRSAYISNSSYVTREVLVTSHHLKPNNDRNVSVQSTISDVDVNKNMTHVNPISNVPTGATDSVDNRININNNDDDIGKGVVVVITRSVVLPKRRRDRLEVIEKTWARDLKNKGARVYIYIYIVIVIYTFTSFNLLTYFHTYLLYLFFLFLFASDTR